MRRSYHLLVVLALVGLVFSSVGAVPQPVSAVDAHSAIPPPTPGTIRPTIAVSPARGYAGQPVTVSGTGVAASPSVRVAWLYGDATVTVAIAGRGADNRYRVTTAVPADAEPGAAKVCAAITGSAQAEFACADFRIDPPPPGSVTGRLPADVVPASAGEVQQAGAATFRLLDTSGAVVASAPIARNGSFAIPRVPPGTYQSAVVGTVSQLVTTQLVTVSPGRATALPPIAKIGQPCALGVSTTSMSADISFTPIFGTVNAKNGILSSIKPIDVGYDFGTYVSGVPLGVTFGISLQSQPSTPIEGVRYQVYRGNTVHAAPPVVRNPGPNGTWPVTINVGQLPAGDLRIIATPIVNGQDSCLGTIKRVRVIADPMKAPSVQGGRTNWNDTQKRYEFSGRFPNLGGVLPLRYPNPPPRLPLLGTIENRLDAGVDVQGIMDLNGTVHLRMMQARASARLLNRDLYNNTRNLLPSGGQRVAINTKDIRQTSVPFGPVTLAQFNQNIPVFNSVVASFWGIVSVRVAITIGFNGELIMQGTLKPLAPAMTTTLTGRIGSSLTITVAIDILLGVVSAGGDAVGAVNLRMPLYIDTQASPPARFNNPSICLTADLRLWARVNLLFTSKRWNLDSYKLFDYPSGCRTSVSAAELQATLQQAVAPPRVLAAPHVAAGTGGRQLSVYIADTAPTQATPRMQVMARFLNPRTGQWDTPTALTNGTRAVMDPVATFYGLNGQAMVAWTENTMTAAEDAAARDDLNVYLNRQEIYYAIWNGQTWGTPQRLTNNTTADGKAAIAGDAYGVTLAWTADTDGDITTRRDSRIVVRNYELTRTSGNWGPEAVLGEGMNAQVSVARTINDSARSIRVLAWTNDADANLDTNGDRRIRMANWDIIPGSSATVPGWLPVDTAGLPAGAESPSLALTSEGDEVRVAFVQRGKDGDGVSDTGVGNRGIIVVGGRSARGAWTVTPVRDGGAAVFGEQPRLAISDYESVLVFRRFGEPGTTGQLGQLALVTQPARSNRLSPPLYLTNERRQNWQPSLALNPDNGQAMILKVGRAATSMASVEALNLTPITTAQPQFSATTLAAGTDPVESLVVGNTPDPALDPTLQLSQPHALPGSTVTISATVRNVGRATATGLSVNFFSGTPDRSTFLGSESVRNLEFNESQVVRFNVAADGTAQPIYAEVVTGGGETTADNNRATASLGALPPPTLVSVDVSPRYGEALELNWLPGDVPGIAGYRILRSTRPGGPYELVGESTSTTYTDLLIERGKPYIYVVQAFNARGALSANSAEMAGVLPLEGLYLPLIRR